MSAMEAHVRGGLLFTLTLVWWIFGVYLYKRKIFGNPTKQGLAVK